MWYRGLILLYLLYSSIHSTIIYAACYGGAGAGANPTRLRVKGRDFNINSFGEIRM